MNSKLFRWGISNRTSKVVTVLCVAFTVFVLLGVFSVQAGAQVPSTPTDISFVSGHDTGKGNSDGITNRAAGLDLSFTVEGSFAVGNNIFLRVQDSGGKDLAFAQESVQAGETSSIDVSASANTFSSDGVYVVTAQQRLGSNAAFRSAWSGGFTVRIDRTNPNLTVTQSGNGAFSTNRTFTISAADSGGLDKVLHFDNVSSCDETASGSPASLTLANGSIDVLVQANEIDCFRVIDIAGNVVHAGTENAPESNGAPSIVGTPTLRSNNDVATVAKVGDIITLSLVVSEALQGSFSVTIAGETATVVKKAGSDTQYTATYQVTSSATSGWASYDIGTLTDQAGNTSDPVSVTLEGSAGVLVDLTLPDTTDPAIVGTPTLSSNNDNATTVAKVGDTITLSFEVSELLESVPTVKIAREVATVTKVSGSDTQYTAEIGVSSDTDEGFARYNIGRLTDLDGNRFNPVLVTPEDEDGVLVDRTAPVFTVPPSWDTMASQFPDGLPIINLDELNASLDIDDIFNTATATDTNPVTLKYAVKTSTSPIRPPSDNCGKPAYTYNLNSITYADIDTVGRTRVCARATDIAGNVTYSIATDSLTVNSDPIVDLPDEPFPPTSPPTLQDAPTDIDLISAHDTGSSSTDGITNRAANQIFTFNVDGSFTQGGTVDLQITDPDDSSVSGTFLKTVASGETSSINVNVAANTFTKEGAYTITATQTANSETSIASFEYTLTIDRTNPAFGRSPSWKSTASQFSGGVYTIDYDEHNVPPLIVDLFSPATVTDTNTVTLRHAVVTSATDPTATCSDSVYTYDLNGISYNDIDSPGKTRVCASAVDVAGNTTYSTATEVLTVDLTAPSISSATLTSNNTNTKVATVGDVLTLAFVTDEALAGTPTVNIANVAATVSGSGTTFSALLIVTSTTQEGAVTYDIGELTDAASNTRNPTAVTTAGSTLVTVDTTDPTLTVVDANNGAISTDRTFTITASDTNTVTVDYLNDVDSCTAQTSGTYASLTLSNGTATRVVEANEQDCFRATDVAGNTTYRSTPVVPGSPPPAVDTTAPSISSATLTSNNTNTKVATVGDVLTLAFVTDEALAGTPTVNIANVAATVSGSGTTFSALLIVTSTTQEGAVTYDIGELTDAASNTRNPTAVTTAGSTLVTVDTTDPTLTVVDANNGAISTDRTFTITASDTNTVTVDYLNDVDSCTAQTSGTYASLTLSNGTATRVVEANEQDCFRATDVAGNVVYKGTDLIAPGISAVSITSTTVVSNNTTDIKFATIDDVITLTFTVSDTLESTPTVTIAGQEATIVAGTEANTYIATITVDADTDIGVVKYDIGTIADTVGNTFNQSEVTTSGDTLVTVDTTDPTLTVVDATNTAVTSDRTFTITASDTNAVNVAYLDNVDSCTAQTSGTYISLTLTSGTATRVVEANEQDCFKATDAAGNTTYTGTPVALPSLLPPAVADTTAPTFTLDYAGSPTIENNTGYYNTSTLTTGGVTVSNIVEENLATATLTLARTDIATAVDVTLAAAVTASTNTVSFANATSIPNGTYAAIVTLTDDAGNSTTKTLDLVVDIATPTITDVSIDNPSSRGSVKAAIAVTHNQTFSETLTASLTGQNCTDLNPITLTDSGISITDVEFRGRIATFNCTITLTDQAGNTSNSFTIPTFTIERNRRSGGGGGGGSSSSLSVGAPQLVPEGSEDPVPEGSGDPAPDTPNPVFSFAPSTPPAPAPTPALEKRTYDIRGVPLSIGSTGLRVRDLQRFLNDYGFTVTEEGDGSKGQETIFFGPATQAALIVFQTAQGLPATGVLDLHTQEAIVIHVEKPVDELQQRIAALKLALQRILQKIQELTEEQSESESQADESETQSESDPQQ